MHYGMLYVFCQDSMSIKPYLHIAPQEKTTAIKRWPSVKSPPKKLTLKPDSQASTSASAIILEK